MSPRHSTVFGDRIQYGFWLVFDSAGGLRLSRAEPALKRGERGMSCTATLPRSLFKTPELRATIAFADTAPDAFKIDVDAVGEALRQVVGCDIDLQIHREESA